jgi:hypothetical protein
MRYTTEMKRVRGPPGTTTNPNNEFAVLKSKNQHIFKRYYTVPVGPTDCCRTFGVVSPRAEVAGGEREPQRIDLDITRPKDSNGTRLLSF